MIFTVFPEGNSLLQMLTTMGRDMDSEAESNQKFDSFDDCSAMFEFAEQGVEIPINGKMELVNLQVPLFPNCKGLYALDYAMGIYQHLTLGPQADSNLNLKFAPITREEIQIVKASRNLPLVQAIFTYTKDYPFLSSSTEMIFPIIAAIRTGLPQAFDYLDARLIKDTDHISQVSNYLLRDKSKVETDSWGEFGVVSVDDITYSEKTQKGLFVD